MRLSLAFLVDSCNWTLRLYSRRPVELHLGTQYFFQAPFGTTKPQQPQQRHKSQGKIKQFLLNRVTQEWRLLPHLFLKKAKITLRTQINLFLNTILEFYLLRKILLNYCTSTSHKSSLSLHRAFCSLSKGYICAFVGVLLK